MYRQPGASHSSPTIAEKSADITGHTPARPSQLT